ncbi:jg24444 [Pararge aegeria aegeria]|uniref:Jg24444 protein n=1 Tax=Pararge aegeria aegeria TaxID=348720 RepID=A0A8S4RI67_9NEOP|nr:jg24444 [Pararge aegeria aegeria]
MILICCLKFGWVLGLWYTSPRSEPRPALTSNVQIYKCRTHCFEEHSARTSNIFLHAICFDHQPLCPAW